MKEIYINTLPEQYTLVTNKKDVVDAIPQFWMKILEASNSSVRKTIIMDTWKNCFDHGEMSKTIQLMNNLLQDVCLANSESGISIIYFYEDNESIYLREGLNPLTKNASKDVEILMEKAPSSLLNFYSQVHNGWFELGTEAMGLLSIENISILGLDDWGILDEIEVDVDLNNVLTLFNNGGGGYLCLDLNANPPIGLIWWSDEAPDVNLSFFDVLDEWVCLGFQ